MSNEMLKMALGEFGIKEEPGTLSNPEVEKYFQALGLSFSDETAWCSAFINYCAIMTNHERSGRLNARSWLSVGRETREPEMGDVVVFWREAVDSWRGHVGLYIREDNFSIWTLGGNQDNMVNIKTYPRERLLGYRKLMIVEG